MEYGTLLNAVTVILIAGCMIWAGAILLEPQNGDDEEVLDIPELQVNAYITSQLILDSQDETLGYKFITVIRDEPYSLPLVQSYDPQKIFLGWSQNSNGEGEILKAGSKLIVNDNIEIMYGIWTEPSPEADVS